MHLKLHYNCNDSKTLLSDAISQKEIRLYVDLCIQLAFFFTTDKAQEVLPHSWEGDACHQECACAQNFVPAQNFESKNNNNNNKNFFNKAKQNKNLIFQTEKKETPQTHENFKYVFVFRLSRKH